jgi:hypothetical protein
MDELRDTLPFGVGYGPGFLTGGGVIVIGKPKQTSPKEDITDTLIRHNMGVVLNEKPSVSLLERLASAGSLPLTGMNATEYLAIISLSTAWLVHVDPKRVRLSELGNEVYQHHTSNF